MGMLHVAQADPRALEVAEAAFLGLQRGAATGDWSGFVDLLSEEVRMMIPLPASEEGTFEGLLVGKDFARMMFGTRHTEKVEGATLECKRVSANGNVVVLEARVEGRLNGEVVANFFTFALVIEGGEIVSMYEYATWTGKHPKSRWGDVTFAREAFPTSIIPWMPSA